MRTKLEGEGTVEAFDATLKHWLTSFKTGMGAEEELGGPPMPTPLKEEEINAVITRVIIVIGREVNPDRSKDSGSDE